MVADFAQVLGKRIYIMGGGTTGFTPPSFPATIQVGIAVGIRVPWLEANRPHHILILARDADGREMLRIEGQVETGRAPGARGETTLVPIAGNGQFRVEGPSNDRVHGSGGRVNEEDVRPNSCPSVGSLVFARGAMPNFDELVFHLDFESHQAGRDRRIVSEPEAEEAWYGERKIVRNRKRRAAQYLVIGKTDAGVPVTIAIQRTNEPGVWLAYTAWPRN